MTKQEFIEKCQEIYLLGKFESRWRDFVYLDWRDRESFDERFRKNKKTVSPFLYIEHPIGGVRGGSCWDGELEGYSINEKPPEFDLFDKILEEISPQLTFFQYKRLCAQVIQYSDRTEHEYYGNHTNYQIRKVDLAELFNWLVENKLID